MTDAASIFTALLVTGLVGSLGHCLGMCGPLVLLAGARFPRQGLAAAPFHLLYHTGRISVYALFGLAVGGLGSIIWHSGQNAVGAAAISIIMGILVFLAGLVYQGWVRLPVAGKVGGWWRSLARRIIGMPRLSGVLLLGALNGLLPCGLVYGALLTTAATGSLWLGGAGMLIFGLGTLPALLFFGVGGGMAALSVRKVMARISGWLVMLIGVQLILRGAAALGLLQHWMVGRVMIW